MGRSYFRRLDNALLHPRRCGPRMEVSVNAMSRCFDWAAARSFDGSLLDGWMDVQDTRRTHTGKRDGELGHRGPFATVFNLFLCVRVE